MTTIRSAPAIARRDNLGTGGYPKDTPSRFSVQRWVLNLYDESTDVGFEREVCQQFSKDAGRPERTLIPQVCLLPRSLRRDLSVANDSALVGTDQMGGMYIEYLRNKAYVLQAGTRVLEGLNGNADIPRKITGSDATWIAAEDGDATEDEPTFDQVTLSPHDLGCYTEVTRRLLLQSNPQAEDIITNELNSALALGIDLAAHYGSGVAGQPVGIASTSGIGSKTFAATQPTYTELVGMQATVLGANGEQGAFFTESTGWEAAMTTEKASGTGQFLVDDQGRVNSRPLFVTNQIVTGDWFYGDYSQLLLGLWSGVEILRDPYTHSIKGKLRLVAFQTCDIALRHPSCFVRGNSGSVA